MVHCTGCHCNFSISGYTSHVQRTQSSPCIAAYHAAIRHENGVEDVEEEDVDMETFSGDIFGDYQDDDFAWPDDGGMSIDVLPLSEDETKFTDGDEDLIDIPPSVSQCAPAQEPDFEVEPFPSPMAGMPIPDSVRGGFGFGTHAHNLSSDGEYGPFRSKLDWGIARWAKLHGPSSVAISKLLEIKGVSRSPWIYQFSITLYCSSVRRWASHTRISTSSIIRSIRNYLAVPTSTAKMLKWLEKLYLCIHEMLLNASMHCTATLSLLSVWFLGLSGTMIGTGASVTITIYTRANGGGRCR